MTRKASLRQGAVEIDRPDDSAGISAEASSKELSEARALLQPLIALKEGFESRNVLASAKSLNTLSHRASGRTAILGTKGLLEAIADTISIWLVEEILPQQSAFYRQQGIRASQDRTGLAGRSRKSQSTAYTMELFSALWRMSKSEDLCKKMLVKAKAHLTFLRTMVADAAPIRVRASNAAALRSVCDLPAGRAAIVASASVSKIAALLERLVVKDGEDEERTNLQLDCIMILSCLVDSDQGRTEVLQHGAGILSKIVLTSAAPILQLSAAACIALCLRGGDIAEHHIVCTTGPSTIVVTADVLLNAAESGQIRHTESGAIACVVQTIQKFASGRPRRMETKFSDAMMSGYAGTISQLAHRLNISERYLLTRDAAASPLATATAKITQPGLPALSDSTTLQMQLDLLDPSAWGKSTPPTLDDGPVHKAYFVSSRNGSRVVRRPASSSQDLNARRRGGELHPPPWGPPPNHGNSVTEGESTPLPDLMAKPGINEIVSSLRFKSRGDRQAWKFLFDHVMKRPGGQLAKHSAEFDSMQETFGELQLMKNNSIRSAMPESGKTQAQHSPDCPMSPDSSRYRNHAGHGPTQHCTCGLCPPYVASIPAILAAGPDPLTSRRSAKSDEMKEESRSEMPSSLSGHHGRSDRISTVDNVDHQGEGSPRMVMTLKSEGGQAHKEFGQATVAQSTRMELTGSQIHTFRRSLESRQGSRGWRIPDTDLEVKEGIPDFDVVMLERGETTESFFSLHPPSFSSPQPPPPPPPRFPAPGSYALATPEEGRAHSRTSMGGTSSRPTPRPSPLASRSRPSSRPSPLVHGKPSPVQPPALSTADRSPIPQLRDFIPDRPSTGDHTARKKADPTSPRPSTAMDIRSQSTSRSFSLGLEGWVGMDPTSASLKESEKDFLSFAMRENPTIATDVTKPKAMSPTKARSKLSKNQGAQDVGEDGRSETVNMIKVSDQGDEVQQGSDGVAFASVPRS